MGGDAHCGLDGPSVIRAHLNGGPRDDQYVAVPCDVFYIPGLPAGFQPFAEQTSCDFSFPKTGAYRARSGWFGDPVPHDLAGTLEFDWQGWL